MSYTQSVIKEIRQKTPTGFSGPIMLGPEQKYVSALLNSHNNNLEEQFILGLDCLTVSWEDDGVKYTTKKFFDGNTATVSENGYYILFIKDNTNAVTPADFYFDENESEFCIPQQGESYATFEQVNDNIYNFVMASMYFNETKKEREILDLWRKGVNNCDIGKQVGYTEGTIRNRKKENK